MKLRPSKLLIIPLVLVLGYLILFSYPYFFSRINRFDSLGFLSAVDEKSVSIQRTYSPQRTTDQFDNHLLKGEKITGEFKSLENNLGIVLVRFLQLSAKVSDTVIFRIKEKDEDNWYYENAYKADQFQPNEYFTFGFSPITNSKDKVYVFEVESQAGTYKNGIGLAQKKPQVALVYKYTREDLKNFNKLFSFSSKKFTYVLNNLDIWQKWQILAASLFSYIFILFIRKKKITFVNTKKKRVALARTSGFLPFLERDILERSLKRLANQMKSEYLLQEKTILRFSKKLTREFYATSIFSLFLNTNMKKRLAIGLLIFLLALIYRFSSTLIIQSDPWVGNYQTTFFYSGLGGQGDYDQFIRAAICALSLCPAILGQNFLIESSILGTFYEIFGFAGGLKAYLYLMLILSSIVATLPYLLLSRKHPLTIGGIIGSLYLSTSDFLTHIALNFPPDNGSLFTFSMFFIVYFLTLQKGNIRWLLFFGLVGAIDALNKALFILNDLVALGLFVPIFFFEKIKVNTASAGEFVKSVFRKKNIKILFLSSLPLLVFLTIYIGWEYIVYIKFYAYYFLGGLFQSGGSNYVSYTSFSESYSAGNIALGLLYLNIQAIIMLKHLIEYTGLQTIFLTPIFFGLLFFTFVKVHKKRIIKEFILLSILSVFFITLLTLVANNYYKIHEVFNGDYIYAWTDQTYIGIFLFLEIIMLFILNFKYSALKLSLPIVPYVIMLIIMAKNAPFARLHTHIVVWSIILLAFIIDWILLNINKYSVKKRFLFGLAALILFISVYMFPRMVIMTTQLNSGFEFSQNQVKYLKWVEGELPSNAVILAGGKSDIVAIAESIRRPIIYNTLWSAAVLINPDQIPGTKSSDFGITGVLFLKGKINMPKVGTADFNIIKELQNKENFNKKKYIILEDDIYIWRGRIIGVADGVFTADPNSTTALHAEDYSIKVYKYNPTLKKAIYELNFRNLVN